MAAYATVADVQARMLRTMSAEEQAVCTSLLNDAAVIINSYAPKTSAEAKQVVSCRMVTRALGDGSTSGVPMGATQGSMSGLGYSQSWTMSGGGSTGELYLSKTDKGLLGTNKSIGSYSPVQELATEVVSE